MFTLLKFLIAVTIAVFLALPAAVLFVVLGAPLLGVAAAMAVPVVIVLAVVGLPLLLAGVAVLVVVSLGMAAFGVVFGLAVALLKLAVMVVLPLALLWWVGKRVFGREEPVRDPVGTSW
jgi:hypothetical protein